MTGQQEVCSLSENYSQTMFTCYPIFSEPPSTCSATLLWRIITSCYDVLYMEHYCGRFVRCLGVIIIIMSPDPLLTLALGTGRLRQTIHKELCRKMLLLQERSGVHSQMQK